MGLEQAVTLPGDMPRWSTVRDLLGRLNYSMQMRMIDGELAFPDEEPSAAWRELRVGTPAGMVTLRREPARVTVVVWGNADAGLLQARNALLWAFAEAGGGKVVEPNGEQLAADFRRDADLPEEMRAT